MIEVAHGESGWYWRSPSGYDQNGEVVDQVAVMPKEMVWLPEFFCHISSYFHDAGVIASRRVDQRRLKYVGRRPISIAREDKK